MATHGGQSFAAVQLGDTVGFLRLGVRRASAPAVQARALQLLAVLSDHILRFRGRPGEERVLTGIGADGTVPPAVALREFALYYGALPGVPRPPGPLAPEGDGTMALELVRQDMARFTPAQQQAIAARTGSGAASRAASIRTVTPAPTLQPLANQAAADIAAHLGPLPGAVTVSTAAAADRAPGEERAYADAQGDKGDGCAVHVYAPFNGLDAVQRRVVITHEVMHCFEFAFGAGSSSGIFQSEWVLEGLADWGALAIIHPGAGDSLDELGTWYGTSLGAPLFARSYDAAGFWGAVDQYVPGGLWPRIKQVILAKDDASAFVAAGGDDPTFREVFGASRFGIPARGAPWNQTDPIPHPHSVVAGTSLAGGGAMSSPGFGAAAYAVPAGGAQPIAVVTTTQGFTRAGTGSADLHDADGQAFCVAASCDCPPGEVSSQGPTTAAPQGLTLVLGNGSHPGAAKVELHPLSDFCQKSDKPPPPNVTVGGSPSSFGQSNGDPHLTTLDGLHYDLQAAGEFTLLRSRSGDMEVQVRQEPLGGPTTTVNTMFGMRVDGHRVVVSKGAVPAVRVDGRATPLTAGQSVAVGGGTVSREADEPVVRVTWPDGSNAAVRSVGFFGLIITLGVVDGRKGAVSGLLGNFDANARNDLVTRSGKRIHYTAHDAALGYPPLATPVGEYRPAFFHDVYHVFGASWRIKQADSLLFYKHGQSTRTFTKPDVPGHVAFVGKLPAKVRRAAEKTCRAAGLTDPARLADCTLDVAATRRKVFAAAAAIAQEDLGSPWRHLATRTPDARPFAIRTPDGSLHVIYADRAITGVTQLSDTRLAPNGAEQPPVAVLGDDRAIESAGAVAPGGTLETFYTAIADAGLPADGLYRQGAAPPFGAWTAFPAVSSAPGASNGQPQAVIRPDGTTLVATSGGDGGRLFRSDPSGAADPAGVPLSTQPGCSPSLVAISQDAAGRAYAAWSQYGCPDGSGTAVAAVDPASGAVSAPLLAPSVAGSLGEQAPTAPETALASPAAPNGGGGAVVAYVEHLEGTTYAIRLWRAGAAQATTIATVKGDLYADPPSDVRLAAEPSTGRLWVAWASGGEDHVAHTKATSLALDGAVATLPVPRSSVADAGLTGWALTARDGAAVVVYARWGGRGGRDGLWTLTVRR